MGRRRKNRWPINMRLRKDIEGHRYGKLTVVEVFRDKGRQWCSCVCDCGNRTVNRVGFITSGHTTSCGCYRVMVMATVNKTHGRSRTRTYSCWRAMRRRCTEPGHHAYKDYGGRGISVCDRWLNSFDKFFEDMGEPPSKQHSIERIDVNGNYEPINCKWATPKEQGMNKRNSVRKNIDEQP
jgi:hypothetical protein